MIDGENTTREGPLAGVRVVEFSGIGPGPYGGMLLADMGAEVLLIDRVGGNGFPNAICDRGKAKLALDIRTPEGQARAFAAVENADILIEGFRPGVMERLGLGPEAAHAHNARLIYARMTGWGQDGPLAKAAGHDINYIALTGALAAMGPAGGLPLPPLNLVGDFGGGSLFLVFGIVLALYERERSGLGQVVDAAIVDGVASMMSFFAGLAASGRISMDRERNLLAGAAPFYRCYRCADGKQIAIGSLEPHFYRLLLERVGAPPQLLAEQNDAQLWQQAGEQLTAIFLTRTCAEWCEILQGTDACFAPVLELDDAPAHPHMAARGVYSVIEGVTHPAPAPRLSRTPGVIGAAAAGEAVLARWAAGVRHD